MLFGFGKVSYEIVDRRDITSEIVLLRLRYQQKNLEIRTGQYIYLQQTIFGEEHPFTVLDHNVQRGELLIAFKKFGKFTTNLQQYLSEIHFWLMDHMVSSIKKDSYNRRDQLCTLQVVLESLLL